VFQDSPMPGDKKDSGPSPGGALRGDASGECCTVRVCHLFLSLLLSHSLSLSHFLSFSLPLSLSPSLPLSVSLSHTHTHTHMRTANSRRTENLRMQMQLDLDETEACHYENIANGLMEKIGRITEERDGLQVLCEQVQKEREDLLLSIEGLKMENVGKDEEVRRASELLDDMQDKIAERDRIIVRIKVSCPLRVTYAECLSSVSGGPTSACVL
jgi:hypothetical protein